MFAQNFQKEANIWYMGELIGLDFNSGTAVPLNDGLIFTDEGVATICNSNGNLLFYTDGRTIRNRLHQLMPNGSGLFGNVSSSQSAVIVPKIGDTTRYFVFTVDAVLGTRGLNYSIVNMTLDNGKGDVELKNVPLRQNSVEKITAVKHCNNRDVWVISHDTASNRYNAFLVTAAGVNTTPVISNTGTVLPGVGTSSIDSSWLGYLKASPNGKKIAAAHWNVNIDLSDFDNATGVVSNSISLLQPTDPHYLSYGVEFSPNSNLLYSTVWYIDPVNGSKKDELFQYDVSLGSAAAIRASKQIISQQFNPQQIYAALQIAPDGKIYMAKNILKHIASIDNPNVYGPGCNFISNAVQWTGTNQRSRFGLPAFIQSYFYPADSFTYTASCQTLSVSFNYIPVANSLSVQWDFGDPASGANNSSVLNNPVHIFSAPGTYDVKLIKFTNCGTDTIRRQVSTDAVNINLGPDTLVCGGTSILLNSSAAGSANIFLWQDGSTNPTFLATTAGLYWVQATNSLGCSRKDSINVTFKPIPVYSLGNDTSVCENNILTLNAAVTSATSYLWNTSASTSTINASLTGIYWCDVNKEGCVFRDSLNLTVILRPVVNLGNDISVCGNNPIILDATNPSCTYLWQNGSTNPTFSATTTGLYWVEARNNSGCTKRDSINIAFNSIPVFNLGPDASICQGDTLTLNATVNSAISYLWSTGAATPTIKAYQAGLYWCQVNNGCIFRDSITITAVLLKPIINLGNDVTLCAGNTVTLNATNPNATYLWQDGSTNPTFVATASGLYWAEVRNNNGCSKRDSINITFTPLPVFNLGTDAAICQNDTLTLNATVSNATSYLWNNGATTATLKAYQAGIYWCEVSKQGCTFRDSLTITAVKPLPLVSLGNDATVCEGITVSLDATYLNSIYLWQDGNTNPVYNVTQPGVYSVQVNLNGCKRSDTISINYNLKPRFTLGPDQAICPGNTITLNPILNPAWQLSWQDGSGGPVYTVTQPGSYSLSATNNCGATLNEVLVSSGICKVFVPNAFTPNNDGKNDQFKVLGTEDVAQFNLKIFNRWGETVFETSDKSKGWDGNLNGRASPIGVFIYILSYKDNNSTESKIIKGTMTLIR